MKKESQMFATLFNGLQRAYTKVNLTDIWENKKGKGKKRVAKVFWVEEKVTVSIYEKHLLGKQGVGIGCVTDSGTSYFGVIDIDEYEWSPNRLKNLCHRIEQLKLPLVPARSKSNGVRLYVFCEETPAEIVKIYLKTCAKMLGFGDSEVFPVATFLEERKEKEGYVKDKGAAIALPYFNGDKTTCAGFWKEDVLSLEEFIKFALSKLCKTDQLKKISGLSLENSGEFADGPPCLQNMAVNSFPEGTRNIALFNIGVYLRLKHGEDGNDRFLEEYNDKLLSPPLESKPFLEVLKSIKKKTYFYTCKKEPLCNVCNKDLCLTRKYGVGSGNGESNITIGNIIKMNSEPPLWYIEVNNRRISVETADLIDIRRFTQLCIEKLHIIPNITMPKLKLLIQKSLDHVVVEEVPEDASMAGQCLNLFHQYLQSKSPAPVREDIFFGHPWYENGYVYFRGKDFMDYLDMQKFRHLDSRKVFLILREYNKEKGGDHEEKVIRVGERSIKVRAIKYDKPVFTIDNNDEDF